MTIPSDVAYCGLYCGDCIIRRQKIGTLARRLLKVVESADYRKLAKGLPAVLPVFEALADHHGLGRTLKAMTHLDCETSCKDGGGSPACPIRTCCREKGLAGCWDCDTPTQCQTLAWLNPVHAGANLQNIKRIRSCGIENFLKGPINW